MSVLYDVIFKSLWQIHDEHWDPLTGFTSPHFLCLSQARTWISNILCCSHFLCLVSWSERLLSVLLILVELLIITNLKLKLIIFILVSLIRFAWNGLLITSQASLLMQYCSKKLILTKPIIDSINFTSTRPDTNMLLLIYNNIICDNVMWYWRHLDKSLINILSVICFSQKGFVFIVILLWEIHSRKSNQW
jgi:hypothetical protein